MTLHELCTDAASRLSARFGPGEAKWMVRIMMSELKGYTQADIAIKSADEVSEYLAGKVKSVTDRLLNDEPIQYIFSSTVFYGLTLKVTPATLIPRPETEELVDMIVRRWSGHDDLRVLDACTGSGCIALALARNLPFSRVDAFDVSTAALEVARQNNAALKTSVRFFEADALHLPAPAQPCYDIIVSNPPYIAEHEKASMEPNVLLHEPHSALFVPDSDPLEFYKALAAYAMEALRAEGMLYFEINPLYAAELKKLMETDGWEDVELYPDMQRLTRFLTAREPER